MTINGSIGGTLSIAGNIVNATGSTGDAVDFIEDRLSGETLIAGTGNTYDGGSDLSQGTLLVASGSTLGTGNAIIDGGTLRLTAPATNIASGRSVLVNQFGVLSFTTGPTQAQLMSLVNPASSGAIALFGSITDANALNLATIGNGLMFLGGSGQAGSNNIYSATSLGANSDGNYRLGADGRFGSSPGAFVLTGTNVLVDGTTPRGTDCWFSHRVAGIPEHIGPRRRWRILPRLVESISTRLRRLAVASP